MKKILVIDDDPKLRYIIRLNLEDAGYEVLLAEDGAPGLAIARAEQPDVVVLDVTMPHMSGFDVCRTLREEAGYPDSSILMLTASSAIEYKKEGFLAGVDDYLVKPFDPRELVWRVEALARRLRRPHLVEQPFSCGELKLYPAAQEVETPLGRIKLTRIEFLILLVLAESPNQVVSLETLQRRVFGADDEGMASMRVHINRIRQRLEPTPELPRYVRTVRGRGYMLAVLRP
jgi:DNA-binding response OmpR family regulator